MYVFIVATVLTMLLSSSPTTSSTTISKEPFKVFFKTCQAQSGATQADLEIIKSRKLPQTKSGRCFVECIFNKAKIMDEGKFNKQGMVVAFSPSTKGDRAKLAQLKELADVCEKEIGDKLYENCIGVQKIVECIAKHGKEYGVELSRPKNSV